MRPVCPCCEGPMLSSREEDNMMCDECFDLGNEELDEYFKACEDNPRELGGD